MDAANEEDKTPAVSVVIPALNAAGTLEETLATLAAQTHTRWEAIVVDDGSVDGTYETACRFAEHDSRVRTVRRPNAGVSAARNAGIAEARFPWLLFLDADDLLEPVALERFLSAVQRRPAADLVHSGWVRLLPDGRRIDETMSIEPADLFGFFARTCGFAIHACLVRRSLVQAVGGFDETLITCEDWDLWQRLFRADLRAIEIPERLAIYRMRARSASNNALRLLSDGFRVIERGHGPDDRVLQPSDRFRMGEDPHGAAAARAGLTAFGVGLTLGNGGDTDELFALAGSRTVFASDPRELGMTIASATALGRAAATGDWLDFEPELWERASAVFARFERQFGIPYGASRAQRGFEDAILAAVERDRPLRVGSSYVVDVAVDEPLADVHVPAGVRRVHFHGSYEGERLGEIVLPVVGGGVTAWLLEDAVAAAWAWPMLVRFLGRRAPAVDDGTTWERFLQELWGTPGLTNADFYDMAASSAEDLAAAAMGPALPVEVAGQLPEIAPGIGSAPVAVGGTVVGTVLLHPRSPRTAQGLRAAITLQFGFELCIAAVRQGLVGRSVEGGTLRSRLQERASQPAEGHATNAVVVGRRTARPGGVAARRWVLPSAVAALAADEAAAEGWVVHGGTVGLPLIYDPSSDVADAHVDCSGIALPPIAPDHPYERQKRARVLELLPRGGAILELGCGDGILTGLLASASGVLTVVDASPAALDAARQRVPTGTNVAFECRDPFTSAANDTYDAVVSFETLHYAGTIERLRLAVKTLAKSVRDSGVLVLLHATILVDGPTEEGFDWPLPFGADTIDRELHAAGLQRDVDEHGRGYRVQRWRRPASRVLRRALARTRRQPSMAPHEEPPVELASYLRTPLANGQASAGPAQSVPMLTYHRVAQTGSSQTARWRLHPEQLEAQLAWLRDAGYHSITLASLVEHVAARRALPRRPVVLTFDDGYVDFAEAAWPLLRRYGFRATLFPVSDYVGGWNAWDAHGDERLELLDWEALRGLRDEGVELGSHSATHPALTALTAEQIAQEALRSRHAFRSELGLSPRTFAYPYGDVDEIVWRILGAAGFDAAVTCVPRHVQLHDHPLLLPRFEVTGDLDVKGLASAIAASAPIESA